MLKDIGGVRPNNRKVLRAQGPRIKYFERLFYLSINYWQNFNEKNKNVFLVVIKVLL